MILNEQNPNERVAKVLIWSGCIYLAGYRSACSVLQCCGEHGAAAFSSLVKWDSNKEWIRDSNRYCSLYIFLWRDVKESGLAVSAAWHLWQVMSVTTNCDAWHVTRVMTRPLPASHWSAAAPGPLIGWCRWGNISTWHHLMPSETGAMRRRNWGLSVGLWLVTLIRKCPVTGQCVGWPHTLLGSHLLLIRSHGDA